MNPLRLHRLWRERWGDIDPHAQDAPYVVFGKDGAWMGRMSRPGPWSHPALVWIMAAIGGVLLLPALATPFDAAGQSIIGFLMLVFAASVRRYMGMLPFLLLAGLTLLAAGRYLAWRLHYTLPPDGLALPGLLLWIAEAGLVTMLALWLSRIVWPLFRTQSGLHDVPEAWPYVDVLVARGSGDGDAAPIPLDVVAGQTRTIAWPDHLLRIFVETPAPDPSPAGIVLDHGVTRVAIDGRAGPPSGNGEYILRIDGGMPNPQMEDPLVLQRWVAWLRRDPHLAMIHTPGHPEAHAAPDAAQNLFGDPDRRHGLALIRRSAWAALPEASGQALASRLEEAGHRTAVSGHPDPDSPWLQGMADPPEADEWLRVDGHDDERTLEIRARLFRLDGHMRRAMPLLLGIPLLATWAIAATGRTMMQAPFSDYLAYALPFALLLFLTWHRTLGSRRASWSSELKEWSMALLLPIATSLAVLLAFAKGLRPAPSAPSMPWKTRAGMGALAIAILAGATRLAGQAADAPWIIAACVVLGFLLALAITRWAIDQEAASLQAALASGARHVVTLRSPQGRLLPAETLDFPARPLRLKSLGQAPDAGSGLRPWQLIVRLSGREHVFDGRLVTAPASTFRFHPGTTSVKAYGDVAGRLASAPLRKHYWLPGPRLGRWLLALPRREGEGRDALLPRPLTDATGIP